MKPILTLLCILAVALAIALAAAAPGEAAGRRKVAGISETSTSTEPPASCQHTEQAPLTHPKSQAEATESQENVENAVVCLINRERATHGNLAPLRRVPWLSQVARGHALNMVENSYFAHTGPDGTLHERYEAVGYFYGTTSWAIGECLYWGGPVSHSTPAQAVKALMAHPGHREIILTAAYTEIGVGAHITPVGWDSETLEGAVYVLDFGMATYG